METQTRLAPGYWALDQHGNMWQLCDTHAEYFARDHGLEWHTYHLWGGYQRGWAGDDQHGPAAWPFAIGDEYDTPPACVDCLTYLEGALTPYGREYVRERFSPDMWKLWGVSEPRECPNHGGSFDCSPFCPLCEGNQEIEVDHVE